MAPAPGIMVTGDRGRSSASSPAAAWAASSRPRRAPGADGDEGERPTSDGLTGAGQAPGTPSYITREQARGEAADQRADVEPAGGDARFDELEGPDLVRASARRVAGGGGDGGGAKVGLGSRQPVGDAAATTLRRGAPRGIDHADAAATP